MQTVSIDGVKLRTLRQVREMTGDITHGYKLHREHRQQELPEAVPQDDATGGITHRETAYHDDR